VLLSDTDVFVWLLTLNTHYTLYHQQRSIDRSLNAKWRSSQDRTAQARDQRIYSFSFHLFSWSSSSFLLLPFLPIITSTSRNSLSETLAHIVSKVFFNFRQISIDTIECRDCISFYSWKSWAHRAGDTDLFSVFCSFNYLVFLFNYRLNYFSSTIQFVVS